MAFETKEEVLEKILEMEKPSCPHCNEEMSLWEVPPVTFSDGLGWGTPYMFLCFNDECPLFVEGWKNLQENYAQNASYRCCCYPGSKNFELMPVFSTFGAKGQIIDDEAMLAEQRLKEAIKKGFNVLATCFQDKDTVTMLRMALDPTEPVRVRLKAAEMIGDIGDLDAVEPLSSLNVGNEKLQKQLKLSVGKIHERFYTRECPFCAEIIKKRAKVCKHCGQEVSGQ
jgi:hypothetical protein